MLRCAPRGMRVCMKIKTVIGYQVMSFWRSPSDWRIFFWQPLSLRGSLSECGNLLRRQIAAVAKSSFVMTVLANFYPLLWAWSMKVCLKKGFRNPSLNWDYTRTIRGSDPNDSLKKPSQPVIPASAGMTKHSTGITFPFLFVRPRLKNTSQE